MALKKLVQVGVQKNELGEIVAVFDLKTLSDEQVADLKTKALENKLREDAKRVSLEKEIADLKSEIGKIKAELQFNRGEISREEYEELCGLNN